ncbi:MAG: hypothetical protein IJJ09_03895 [Synergistaceae bacterium]|nr:hypothetical protein [Synergistaceae bacterium]
MAKWRIFNVMQYEKHLETGETLLTEEQIRVALLSHRTVKRWAYICHDKDVYLALDEEQNSDHKAGEIKPRHWHIVLECGSNVEIGVVARWLGVAENFVETAKGAGAFLDCVQYLTHEQEKQQLLGKRLYADSEVKSNFEFRAELDKRAENRAKYNRDLNLKERIRMEVLLNGMTLRQVIDKYPYEFQQDFAYLERCRIRYISKIAPMPRRRINYYVEGSGGIGKGLISRALARALIDRDNLLKDDEIFFEVGADRTSFEGYDGQPVLIWNDCRASTLLTKLDGRENVFNVFDPHPADIQQNIKYGSIRLNNEINIVNSVQTWKEFLDELAAEYKRNGQIHKAEDKRQSYRRFPFFLVLHEEDYDLGMNKGVFDGTREFEQYMMYRGMQANMRRIADRCGDNYELYNLETKKIVQPITEKHEELKELMAHQQQATAEEIAEEFKDSGKQFGETVLVDARTGKETVIFPSPKRE